MSRRVRRSLADVQGQISPSSCCANVTSHCTRRIVSSARLSNPGSAHLPTHNVATLPKEGNRGDVVRRMIIILNYPKRNRPRRFLEKGPIVPKARIRKKGSKHEKNLLRKETLRNKVVTGKEKNFIITTKKNVDLYNKKTRFKVH